MPQLARIITTLWLLVHLAVAIPTPYELNRVPRHVWDTDPVKRDEANDAIGLSDHEKFVWASSDEPHKKAVVVSMVAWSKQDERILDMDKFAFALESANCQEGETTLKFKNDLVFFAAKIAWNWVNYNDMRSFVLIPSWKGCGDDRSHDPLVVRKVTFDSKAKEVQLDASKSTWKQVMNTFVLDFGEVVLGGGRENAKRDIIPDLDEKFRLDVGATLPQQIFEWKIDKGALNASLTANCNDCGTQGTLVFAGHIEASLGWGGFDVDKFELSVTPENVQAGVNLSLDFEGQLDFRGLTGQAPEAEITLLEIPVSGWNIPNIFEFGPRIQLNAGYGIDYIGGSASASAGIVVKIPNDAIAKLDLLAEDSLQISGWTPEVETQPLEIQAQVDAQAYLYTEIALSVSLTILDDNGFGVDLAFKLPEVTVTATGGVDSEGFCPNKPEPWGVDIDASVGVDLGLEAWKELDGDKDPLYEATLFEKPDLFTFPGFCMGSDEISEGYCPGEEPIDENDLDEAEPVENDADNEPALAKRTVDLVSNLAARQGPAAGRDDMYALCDKKAEDYPIRVLEYRTPKALKANTKVPIVKPRVGCSPKQKSGCKPDTDVEVITTDMQQRSVLMSDIANDDGMAKRKRRWATEHIYEGNWLRDFMNHLQKKAAGVVGGTCDDVLFKAFFKLEPTGVTPPKDKPKNYMEAMLQQLGTIYTENTRLAIVPQSQNTHKNRMFANWNIVGYFKRAKDNAKTPVANNHHRRACDLARVVSTCKYLNADLVVAGLKETIAGIDNVLDAMDKDVNAKHPKISSYKDEHKIFFEALYDRAILNARTRLQNYADWMKDKNGMDQLSPAAQREIRALANLTPTKGIDPAWKDFCPRDFVY